MNHLRDSNMYGELAVFTGTANPELAKETCQYLGIEMGGANVFQFANGNTFVRLAESVRGKDVFIIQPTSHPTNDNVMELLIFIDTLRRDSAGRITAVIPYYGYGRTDKKDQPRVPITARLVADMITVAGADRFLTIDLHAGQVQGFFSIPTDELPALPLLVDHFQQQAISDLVVVSPDIGGVRRARNFAEKLGAPLAIIEKRRSLDGKGTEFFNLIGEVKGKNVIVVDDEIDTAGTLVKAGAFVKEYGADDVYACATHAIFSPPAAERLRDSVFREVVVTNTVAIKEEKSAIIGNKLRVVSVGNLIGEVIHRIHVGRSVGEMFDE